MSLYRFHVAFVALFLAASTCHAQTVDWKSLGKPLADDTKPMTDRYVYSQEETSTDKTIGIDKPILAPNEINDWLAQRIPEALSFKASDYDAKVVTNQRSFTPKGYAEYVNSLNAAQLPLVVKQKRFTVSGVVIDPANITAKGIRALEDKTNVYVWQLDVPVSLNYAGINLGDAKSYKVLLRIELLRIPMKDDNTLVAINSWRLEEYKQTIIPEPKPAPPDPYAE